MMATSRRPVPRMVPHGDWYRRLHQPFTTVIQLVHSINTVTSTYVGTDDPNRMDPLDGHVAVFANMTKRMHEWRDQRVAVVDADGWIAIGFACDRLTLDSLGRVAWWGCEMGWASLESLNALDPVEIAMKESFARSALGAHDWWKEGT